MAEAPALGRLERDDGCEAADEGEEAAAGDDGEQAASGEVIPPMLARVGSPWSSESSSSSIRGDLRRQRSPGFGAARQRVAPLSVSLFATSPPAIGVDSEPPSPMPTGSEAAGAMRWPLSLRLATPSSSCSAALYRASTPGTPLPDRGDLRLIAGDVSAILFDFDGTLTATPGDMAVRCRKSQELRERAPLLEPRLRGLRDSGILLGIITKSSEATVRGALAAAELTELFAGPIHAKASGFEGKAGCIEDLVRMGGLRSLGAEGWRRVVLVDDDVMELDRARARGIQTYAAPSEGGLQKEDFDEIYRGLGLPLCEA